MADPVRLGDVLALLPQLIDSACRCGHPLSKHYGGMACNVTHQSPYLRCPIIGARVEIRCACRLYREAKCRS